MKPSVSSRSQVVIRTLSSALLVCLLITAFGSLSCTMPNLETPECSEARDSVKQFYSWYFGTPADDKDKHLEIRNRFISASFRPFMRGSNDWERDPFTLTLNLPTTFKLAQCEVAQSNTVNVNVQFLWKPGEKSETGETFKVVQVKVEKEDSSWKIVEVLPDKQ